MPSYVAVATKQADETNWSVLFPDFPEIASAAERSDDIFPQAQDALATAIEMRLETGEGIPDPSPPEDVVAERRADARVLLLSVPAEIPNEAIRVNMSIDRVLLSRIDRAAERRGMSRSAFVAEGARRMIRDG